MGEIITVLSLPGHLQVYVVHIILVGRVVSEGMHYNCHSKIDMKRTRYDVQSALH